MVDTLAPTLTVSVDQSSVKAGDQVTVTLTSSEPLDGTAGDVMGALTTPNLSMVGGSATVAGDTYTATYEALADVEDATNEVSVAAGALGDAAGNTNAAVSSANYVVDSVTPEIDGIVRVGPNDAATGELTNADTLHFRVNFSEPVDLSTVTPGDFVVSAANPDGSDATGLALTIESGFLADDGQIGTGSLEPGTMMDHTYLVVSGTGLVSFDGTIELAPSTGGAFADSVGNVADGAAMLATGVTPETYTIDNSIGHTVTIDATVMKGGDAATVTIVFDEAPVGLALDNLFLSGVADSAGLFSDLQADTSDADGLTYTATFTAPSDIDDPSAMIYVDGYGDAAGNQAGLTDNESFTEPTIEIDNTSPEGTSQAMHFGPDGSSKTGIVQSGDGIELQFHPGTATDIASVSFDVGGITGARAIDLTTSDSWTDGDISALRAHFEIFVHDHASVQAAKDTAAEDFEALYATTDSGGTWDGNPWMLMAGTAESGYTDGTMVEADISFSNGADTFSLTAGDYWTDDAITAYQGAWRDARYNDPAVEAAEQDAAAEFIGLYADPLSLSDGDAVAADLSVASHTVVGEDFSGMGSMDPGMDSGYDTSMDSGYDTSMDSGLRLRHQYGLRRRHSINLLCLGRGRPGWSEL